MFCYIHIPFCESRCKYCRFSTFSGKNDLEKEKYADYLVKSIKNTKCKIQNIKLKSIYFGGGTPTSLSFVLLQKIIKSLENKFVFNKDIEITLESNIKDINEINLNLWQNVGINRLSIGIQTLNNNSLKEIGRISREEIIEKLDMVKILCHSELDSESIVHGFILKQCIKNSGLNLEQQYSKTQGRFPSSREGQKGDNLTISLDFIIGLPYVKKGGVLEDLKYIINNYDFVNHISLYMLEEYYDYPKKWQECSIDEDEYLEEYKNCKKYLEENGFSRYELSNFAKQGFECKHNQAYWNHSDIISFGLGSHGFIDGERYAYSKNFIDYYSGKFELKENLSKDDIFLEKVMFGLRTSGLEKDIYELLNKEKIKYFVKEKLLDIVDNKLILGDNGVTLIDYIIKEIV